MRFSLYLASILKMPDTLKNCHIIVIIAAFVNPSNQSSANLQRQGKISIRRILQRVTDRIFKTMLDWVQEEKEQAALPNEAGRKGPEHGQVKGLP